MHEMFWDKLSFLSGKNFVEKFSISFTMYFIMTIIMGKDFLENYNTSFALLLWIIFSGVMDDMAFLALWLGYN